MSEVEENKVNSQKEYNDKLFENDEQKQKFEKFIKDYLPSILKEADYDELYGYQLSPDGEFYQEEARDTLVFKFLKARSFDLEAAKTQLLESLKWRKSFQPLKAAFIEKHDEKLLEVGVLTKNEDEFISWNIYGGAKEIFDDLDGFLRYRIGLMERSLQLIDFTNPELSQMAQVHDYEGVSFIRFDSKTSKASKTVVNIFQSHYPELLSRKFFVNVPSLMSWIYDFVKKWLPTETTRKFKMLHDGKKLAGYLGEGIPVKYGGKGALLQEQDIKDVRPTPYSTFILGNQFTEEVD